MKESSLEHDVESYLNLKVKAAGGRSIKLLAAYEEGIPDRLIVLPGGRIFFCELKRPKGGKLSDMQIYKIAKLRKLGCTVYVPRNKQMIDEMIEEETSGVQAT